MLTASSACTTPVGCRTASQWARLFLPRENSTCEIASRSREGGRRGGGWQERHGCQDGGDYRCRKGGVQLHRGESPVSSLTDPIQRSNKGLMAGRSLCPLCNHFNYIKTECSFREFLLDYSTKGSSYSIRDSTKGTLSKIPSCNSPS